MICCKFKDLTLPIKELIINTVIFFSGNKVFLNAF